MRTRRRSRPRKPASNEAIFEPNNTITRWLKPRGICTYTNGKLCMELYKLALKKFVDDYNIQLCTDIEVKNIKRKELTLLEYTAYNHLTDFRNYIIDNIPNYIIQYEQ